MRLAYVIKFVSDMDRATEFYEKTLTLPLKFRSPHWTEFATGETTLALHPASPEHLAGSVQLGFNQEDLASFYEKREQHGVVFTTPPAPQHGTTLARFLDSEGSECSISG